MDLVPAAGDESSPVAVPKISVLTKKSPRKAAPAECAVTLWPHQEAMLARCLEIESDPAKAKICIRNKERYWDKKNIPRIEAPVSIGVMNDPPGCGKTYAVLSLIATDPTVGTKDRKMNLIVVPQNIYAQWESAINTMFPQETSKIRTRFCNVYGDVTGFYRSNPFREYDIVLVNDVFAETLCTSINDANKKCEDPVTLERRCREYLEEGERCSNCVEIRRLIIDEIDGVEERLYTPVPAEMVWLVSASFEYKPTNGKEGAAPYFGSKGAGQGAIVGPYGFAEADIPRVFCKCDPAFVAEHLKFEDPVAETLVCEDNEIVLFKGLVPEEAMIGLNTGDRRPLLKYMGKTFPPRSRTLLELAQLHQSDLYVGSKDKLDEYRKTVEELESERDNDNKSYTSQDDYLIHEYRSHITRLEKEFYKSTDLERRLTAFKPSDPAKTKDAVFKKDICDRIRANPEHKWLIFNDNAQALFEASDLLKDLGIRHVMLDGGSAEAISKAIARYKNPEENIRALLLNSKLEGAGMNLENTTHLLFMHATQKRMVEQVVGRAQRFGRAGPLHIIGLFNKNEVENLNSLEDYRDSKNKYTVEYTESCATVSDTSNAIAGSAAASTSASVNGSTVEGTVLKMS